MSARPWEMAPEGARAERAAALAACLPRLETERLVLRAPGIADFEGYTEATRGAEWLDGADERHAQWLDWCEMVASWLMRGHGLLSVEARPGVWGDLPGGTLLGFVALTHEYGDPEAELGWMLRPAARRRGVATEAAAALRDLARNEGLVPLVSYIDPANAASARVARRLGAERDPRAEADVDAQVWRHFPRGTA